MKLSIIIPVFNEEKTILQTLRKVEKVEIKGVRKEIIIIDDGSIDNTVVQLQAINNKDFKIIYHDKNQGKGAAVSTGIKNASGDYIIIQDADCEYDPKYIPILMVPIINHTAEIVYGTRLNRMPDVKKEEKTPRFLIHYFGNRALSFLTSTLYGQWITDMETGYKVFPKNALKDIKLNAKSFDFEPEITAKFLKKGYKILEVPISTIPRGYEEGKKLNTVKDGITALWTLIKYRFVEK